MKGLMSLGFIGLILSVLILGCTDNNKIIVDSNNCDVFYHNIKDNTVLDTCKIHIYCENTTGIIIKNNIFDCNGTIHLTLNNSKGIYISGNNISSNLNIIDSENIAIVGYNLRAMMSIRNKVNYILSPE